MKRVLVATLAVLLIAGCAGPSSKPKGAESGLTAEQLKTKHLSTVCNFKMDGTDGFHAKLIDCDSGKLEDGKLDAASIAWEGNDQANSWFWNRHGTITVTVYYPGNHGNSAPLSISAGVQKDQSATAKATIKWPTASGFGTYTLDLQFENFRDSNPWYFPYSPQPDPGHGSQDYKLTKSGWI